MALYTSAPTDADVGTEVSGGGYARQQVTFGPPTDGVTSNTAQVTFPEATAAWGTVTHLGLRSAAAGGNLLWQNSLTASKTVNPTDQLIFKIGQITPALS